LCAKHALGSNLISGLYVKFADLVEVLLTC
jgi:hypothetical protein